jgi:Tol biopolymer transport system component
MKPSDVILSDELIAGALAVRARPVDNRLAGDILGRTASLPQARPWWAALRPLGRGAALVFAILLVIVSVAAALVGARLLETTPPVHHNGPIAVVSQDCYVGLVDPASGTRQPVASFHDVCDAGGLLAIDISASPDGRRLALAVQRNCGGCSSAPTAAETAAQGYWLLDLATRSLKRVAGCSPACNQVTISGDGRQMAFSALGDHPSLQVADAGSGATTSIPLDGDAWDPAFSPDGGRVALVTTPQMCGATACNGGADPSTLWVVDTVEQRTFPAFSQPGLSEQIPTWSPVDSKLIAVGTSANGHDGPVRVVNADGTGSTVLDVPATGEMPDGLAWSPDGRALFYEHLEAEAENHFTLSVWSSPSDGSPARQVFAAPCCDPQFGHIALSPDGTEIAIALAYYDGSQPSGIYAFPVDGGPPRVVSELESATFGTGNNLLWLEAP